MIKYIAILFAQYTLCLLYRCKAIDPLVIGVFVLDGGRGSGIGLA